MPSFSKTLYVLPDAQRVEAALSAAAATAAIVDAPAYLTWSQWLEKCEPAAVRSKKRISATAGAWLVHSLVPAQGSPFGSHAREARFAAQAWELIQQLKRQGATPLHLQKAAAGVDAELSAKAQFLAKLWQDYDAALLERGRLDGEDVLRALTAQFEQRWPAPMQGVKRLELLHFYDFPRSRLMLVNAVAKQCALQKVELVLEAPGGGPDEVDALTNEAFALLEKPSNTWEAELRKTDSVQTGHPLAQVAQRLFGGDDREVDAPGLRCVVAAAPRDELKEIARGIRRQIDEGCPPELIAVAARDLGCEAEALAELLAGYGVPARARRGLPLASSPLGRLALDFPRWVAGDFSREGLMRWLENERFAARHRVPAGSFALLLQAGVRDNLLGAEGKEGAYAVRLQRLADLGDEDTRRRVGELKACLSAVLEAGRGLRAAKTTQQLLDAWWTAVTSLGLMDEAPGFLGAGEGDRAWQRHLHTALAQEEQAQATLQDLHNGLVEAVEAAGVKSQRLSLDEWGRWLNQAAGGLSLPVLGPRSGVVTIVDLRELVGRAFQHVWLLGMTEGRFPSEASSAGLFSEAETRALNGAASSTLFRLSARVGPSEPLSLRLAEDRLLFHVALSSATQTVTLTYAATDASGREATRSSFIDDLERRTRSLKPRVAAQQAAPPLNDLLNEDELRLRCALETVTLPGERLTDAERLGPLLVAQLQGEAWLKNARALGLQERERLKFYSSDEVAPSVFSGAVDGAALRRPLAEWFPFDAQHPLSASWLERFGNCRFQGFVEQVLLGREAEEGSEDTSSSVHGKLLHRTLEYWVGLLPDNPEAADEDELQRSLDTALDKAAAHIEAKEPTGHPVLWRLTVKRSRAQLWKLWKRTALGRESGIEKQLTEVRFGGKRPHASLEQVVLPAALEGESPVYLTGEIDRWDSGSTHRVVDYKRGRAITAPELYRRLGNTHFQLPLYLLAVRQAAGTSAPLDAALVTVREPKALWLSEVLPQGHSLSALLATDGPTRERLAAEGKKNIASAVHTLVAQIRQGDFAARPQDCKYCSVKSVCRISERAFVSGDDEA